MSKREEIAIIIPCYNYGAFLSESIESALAQTYSATEIVISDDASSDNSWEIIEEYQRRYPKLIRGNRNKKNLGTAGNHNTAIPLTTSKFICFLSADDRLAPNYLEETIKAITSDDSLAIAYTDLTLFGPHAQEIYQRFRRHRSGYENYNGTFVIEFPDFNEESREELLNKTNFIHGTSLLRREALEAVGAYTIDSSVPEDYDLFRKLVSAAYKAIRVPQPLLEYRQHSKTQTNIVFDTRKQLNWLKQKHQTMRQELENCYQTIQRLRSQLENKNEILAKIRQSTPTFSVILEYCGGAKTDTLYKQLSLDNPLRTIAVLDNSSPSNRSQFISHQTEKNLFIGGGIQACLAIAHSNNAKYLFFIANDVEPLSAIDISYFENLIASDPDIVQIGAAISPDSDKAKYYPWMIQQDDKQVRQVPHCDLLLGIIRLDFLESFGGFPQSISGYGYDFELAYQAKLQGKKILISDAHLYRHLFSSNKNKQAFGGNWNKNEEMREVYNKRYGDWEKIVPKAQLTNSNH